MRAARVACMAAMPRAIAATSAAKDSNVRGAPEDVDDNPDAADGAGADGTGREAEVDGGYVDVDGGPDISNTRLLRSLVRRERDRRL